MNRVLLLVEGQTEETFVGVLLQPYFARMGLYFTPIIVETSSGHKGGMVSYVKVKKQIKRLCNDTAAHVSTMFDLYALPDDFPGKSSPKWEQCRNGADKAAFVEQEMVYDIDRPNFIPYIQVHEFEALLFTNPSHFLRWVDDPQTVHKLQKVQAGCAPEDINDNKNTTPSKRILSVMPTFQKVVHGSSIARSIGLDAMRSACPHFDGWLKNSKHL
ncbi:MAG: DUF4276 family protein [Betaproteobacteria bacterium]|nr:DUF4276 family protein [Betaproteobacteria bacterium]